MNFPFLSNRDVDALGLGAAAGLVHALADITVLGLAGVDFAVADALLLTAFYAVLAAVSCYLGWAILSRLYRLIRGGQLPGRHGIVLLLAAGVNGVYLYLLPSSSRLLLGCLGLTASAILLRITWRSLERTLVAVLTLLAISSSLCAALEISVSLAEVNPSLQWQFLLAVTLPAMFSFFLLYLTLAVPPEPAGRFSNLGPCALAVVPLIGSAVTLPLEFDWQKPSAGDVSGSRESTRPNIVLIVLDTLRADHMDLFGYERETMPLLASWAREEAFLFRSMTATSSWTLPSHASMFTGMYPYAHGAHLPFVDDETAAASAYALREDAQTLPEFLQKLGYYTAGISATGIPLDFGLERGFSYIHTPKGNLTRAASSVWSYRFSLSRGESTLASLILDIPPRVLSPYFQVFTHSEPAYARASFVRENLEEWLSGAPSPFFLFANFLDCHEPYLPLPEDKGVFAPPRDGVRWSGGYPHALLKSVIAGEDEFTQHELDYLTGAYDEEMRGLDRELSAFLQALRAEGLYDNSLIIVTSDHGEGFFEHGTMSHGRTLYEEEVTVPLIVKLPRGASVDSSLIGDHMQFVDFFPTVAELLGELPGLPPGVEGSPWGRGRDFALSELYCQSCTSRGSQPEGPIEELQRELVAVTAGSRKTIRSVPSGVEETYDLSTDPLEQEELSQEQTSDGDDGTAAAVFELRDSRAHRQMSNSDLDPSSGEK